MALSRKAKQFPDLVKLAKKRWSMGKVPPGDRDDVSQNAAVEALKAGTYDESRPFEPWFGAVVDKAVAKYFDARSRSEEYLSREVEDEFSAVDAGMDRLEASELEAEIAEAVVEFFEASSDDVKETVALLANGLSMDEIGARLGISEGTAKARISRFGERFKTKFRRMGIGNRVDVTLILQIYQGEVFRMGTGSVFFTGKVGGDFTGNGNNNVVDVHFDHVALGMGKMKAFVEADETIPVDVKARVVDELSDIKAEASKAVPSFEFIQRGMRNLIQLFPGIKAIAGQLGVPFFA